MADCKPLFKTLDDGTGQGSAAHKVLEGDSPSSKNGSIGFSFKDSSGNLILPQLTAAGAIVVDTEGQNGVCKHAYAEDVNGNLSFVDLASITGQLNKKYNMFEVAVSSTLETIYQLVHIDDDGGASPTETVLASFIVGPGQYSICCKLDCQEVDTTGGTGVQTLKIKGKNLDTACAMHASLSLEEV